MVQYVRSSADNWWIGCMQEKKLRRWAVPPIYVFFAAEAACESLAAQIVTGVLDEEKRPERRRRSSQDGDSVWN